jgi:hypothetical protein
LSVGVASTPVRASMMPRMFPVLAQASHRPSGLNVISETGFLC